MSMGFLILLIALISVAAGAYLLLGNTKEKQADQDAPVVESTESVEENVEQGTQGEDQSNQREDVQMEEDEVRKAEEERLAREKAESEKRLREEAARIKAERERFEREQAEKKRRAEEEALKKKAAEEKILQESNPPSEGVGTVSTPGKNTPAKEEILEEKPAVSAQPEGPEPGSTTTQQ